MRLQRRLIVAYVILVQDSSCHKINRLNQTSPCDKITRISHSEADLIAKRGITLLRAMLAEEEGRWSGVRHGRATCDTRAFNQHTDMFNTYHCNDLNVPAIIRKFYRQEPVGLKSMTPGALPPPECGDNGPESWFEMMRHGTDGTPRTEILASLGAEGVGELDEILNLATNYMR
jgi:hypothetical protein